MFYNRFLTIDHGGVTKFSVGAIRGQTPSAFNWRLVGALVANLAAWWLIGSTAFGL